MQLVEIAFCTPEVVKLICSRLRRLLRFSRRNIPTCPAIASGQARLWQSNSCTDTIFWHNSGEMLSPVCDFKFEEPLDSSWQYVSAIAGLFFPHCIVLHLESCIFQVLHWNHNNNDHQHNHYDAKATTRLSGLCNWSRAKGSKSVSWKLLEIEQSGPWGCNAWQQLL